MKIDGYKLVTHWDPEEFERQVNNCIVAGFQPSGNLIILQTAPVTYVQAMVYVKGKVLERSGEPYG